MDKYVTNEENYTFYDYKFNKTTLRYVVMEETKSVFLCLLPNEKYDLMNTTLKKVVIDDEGYPNHIDWFAGSIVHLHFSHHATSAYHNSLKLSESTKALKFDKQDVIEVENKQIIKTYLKADEGYSVCHTLTHFGDENGFEVKSEVVNNTGKELMLEMITSASLDNLCPFMTDDGSKDLVFHTFKGGWATEGKLISQTLPEINMEKSWGGSFECEKISTIGSKSVGRYHPYAALENTKIGCTWGIKLKHNASWQIELSRYGTPLSLSTGIADYKTGAWRKLLKNGDSFETPVAYIAVANGGIEEVSNDLIEMNNRDIDAYGEQGMPIIFNDWVTHWGDTSEEKLLSLAEKIKDTKVKYFIVDDGWQKGTVGDWLVDETKFPNGFKAYTDKIRKMGMIPGMWMEFESVRTTSDKFKSEEDIFLTKDGYQIVNGVTKFLDLRKKEVVEYLDNILIKHMKDNGIGYLKVDYNANIGYGCDGAESLGEGLRQQTEAVTAYFKRLKEQIPDLIIENCASGGARLDGVMMGVSAMSSFSDAHECIEVPVVAANMHYLISPCQSQVWCVIKETFDLNHMKYIIAAGFLGRLCWSGHIDKLADWQMNMIYQAEDFYEEVCDIIKDGRSVIYRTNIINNRYPEGAQAVVRYSKDKKKALVVYHIFTNDKSLKIKLDGEFKISKSLYETDCKIENGYLEVSGDGRMGNALVLDIDN